MMKLGVFSSTLFRILCLAIFWWSSGGGVCRKNAFQGAVQAFVLQHHSALAVTARRPSNQQSLRQRPMGRSASPPSSSDDRQRGRNTASANKKNVQQRRQQQARHSHRAPPQRSNSNNPSLQINKKILELGQQKDWNGLLKLMVEERRNFNNVNCATLMSQLGRIRSFNKSDPRFLAYLNALAQIIVKRGLPWIQLRELSNTIHAIAKMQLKNQHSKQILNWVSQPEVAAQFVKEGNPQQVANVAWACAKLDHKDPKLFAEIEQQASWLVEKGNPQDVANTAWAFAALGHDAPKFFAEIAQQASWLVEEGNPQDVANTAWAFAALGHDAPKFFAEIEQQASWLVEKGNPQDVANTAWAFATLGHDARKLFTEIEQQASWLVEKGNPQDVANTAWAFATLGHDARKLFTEIEQQASWLVNEGNPQAVANTAWAFAKLGYDAPRLFAEIEQQSSWFVKEGKPQEVANTAWAFATLGYDAPSLFAEIEQQATWLVEEGNSQAVANTAWAFAKLGYDAPKIFAEIEQNVDKIIKDGNAQDFSNTCYAIVVLGMVKKHETLLKQLWSSALSLFNVDENIMDEGFSQLAQIQIIAQADGVPLSSFPQKMLEKMNQILENEDENEQSRLSMEVSQLLTEIGFNHQLEVAPNASVSASMLAIDIASIERMMAIEFDGPSHYLKSLATDNLTYNENGPTKAKRRFLQQLGWTVININYKDFVQARREKNEIHWIQALLESRGFSI